MAKKVESEAMSERGCGFFVGKINKNEEMKNENFKKIVIKMLKGFLLMR